MRPRLQASFLGDSQDTNLQKERNRRKTVTAVYKYSHIRTTFFLTGG